MPSLFNPCIFLFLAGLLISPTAFAKLFCHQMFARQASTADVNLAQTLAQQTATATEGLAPARTSWRAWRGYGVLIGGMVGSAALTSYLGSQLPPQLQFTSVFISQLSVLGVLVWGAPIWEPVSSRFRLWAFGRQRDEFALASSATELENTWVRTQTMYSLNAQMSRNIINQFILTVKDNFYQAYRAYNESNPVYSADQVAEAAYRMTTLFRDIAPRDESVAAAVRSAFTHHIEINDKFIEMVWERLKKIDDHWDQPEMQQHYEAILETWLGPPQRSSADIPLPTPSR